MKNLLAHLQKKYAKLPLWAWASAAGGAGWYFMKRKSPTAAGQVASGDGLPAPVDAYGSSDNTGDLGSVAPVDNGAGAGGQLTGTAEQFADAGVTQDFQDFMAGLYADEKSKHDSTTAPETPKTEAVDPSTGKTATVPPKGEAKSKRPRGLAKWIPSRKGERGHWALPNGSWTSAPKGQQKTPKPKTVKPTTTKPRRTNRVGTMIGKGNAGARARTRPKPVAKPAARPRGIAKKTTAVAKTKPKRTPPRRPIRAGRN